MRYKFYTCDVFTETHFGGNPLAVLPEAEGLSAEQMQLIAREFNFSESAFVFPAESGHTRRVRIFTPSYEMPFAGHPNVGTAFVLAMMGAFGRIESSITVTFEEMAGLVPITIYEADGRFTYRIAQGVEMGRPSMILARAEKVDGVVQTTGVGGACVMISEGFIQVG